MRFMHALRELVLGETWALPAGVAGAVGVAAVARVLAGPGGWWRDGGGFLLAALLVLALVGALRRGGR
jgi:hypothetical protein